MDGDAALMQPLESGGVPSYSHIWTGDAPSPPRNPLRPPHTGPHPSLIQPTLQPPRVAAAPQVKATGGQPHRDASAAAPISFMGLNARQLAAIGAACILLLILITGM
ncbi:hypothetical protein [Medusavirus stheno T3]|uniref:Uncharacterized protein n=1 Tax=Medusavirus stheno T3 TaxID=3069717 RepID=A0A7S7YEZ5_9VIRU|nr:hypothetical protein QKU73_gp197 [Acanthamoeba castellanii medusavirus]QPB44578.1 hypothetical protein [Medusavirus stheno T3]